MESTGKPQVDVLIPTYNPNPEHLREALDGLLKQTFTQWRALIRDDASQVDVRSMIEDYRDDPRITFQHSDEQLGIGGNWNECFEQTCAPLVAYLFQDDYWEPIYLLRLRT